MQKTMAICVFGATVFLPAPGIAASCESLTSLTLPNTTITLARSVAAGEFTPRFPVQPGANFKEMRAFCRIAATLAPSKDSDIKIEVWMPASGWNGKFQAVGNGGWSGAIVYPGLARALARAMLPPVPTRDTQAGVEASR
jgi:feruloyl esterase